MQVRLLQIKAWVSRGKVGFGEGHHQFAGAISQFWVTLSKFGGQLLQVMRLFEKPARSANRIQSPGLLESVFIGQNHTFAQDSVEEVIAVLPLLKKALWSDWQQSEGWTVTEFPDCFAEDA